MTQNISKEQARSKIKELVEKFESHKDEYKTGNYNETEARIQFINPFFEALGWDVNNTNAVAESYKEVIHEDKIKIGGKTKAPDYGFRIDGNRKFFVEAKKPNVKIHDDAEPAYQLRRYGWNANLHVSILTDFEEFAVYDCTKKPSFDDKAAVCRIEYFNYQQYEEKFDYLWEIFSKEQVKNGSFDKYAQNAKNKKGTDDVDAEFLKSLNEWRLLLANNIIRNYNGISDDALSYSLQKIMDRLIFLRICEARGVEPDEQLNHIIAKGNKQIFDNLKVIFHLADQKYNSGLFDYKKDTITDNLIIDDKVLRQIIENMYYPLCPYEFSVMPVEIMGHSYEQYLGNVITIKGKGVSIEPKPEVRKAGGVYYTPQYIVDYIVKNTLGKLVDGKTPEEVAKIKICDPACGSGSFLLGAYDFLLKWHKDYYNKHQQKKQDRFITPDGNLHTQIKKQILLNNIYGVDIDTNAVEVTKLSLMLKAMEGETNQSINQQLSFLHERVLPSLDDNIKSGNSLIDTDFYANAMDFEPEEEKKIKPFSWKEEFKAVFAQGGFDIVIGNPPWVDLKGHPSQLVKYYFAKFSSTENRINLFSIFIEKSLSILSKKGCFGFIIPNSLLYQSSYSKIRNIILNQWNIGSIIRLPDNVFVGVKAETIIITIDSSTKKTDCCIYDRQEIINKIDIDSSQNFKILESKQWANNELSVFDIFSSDKDKGLLNKIDNNKTELSEICDFTLGITPYDKYKGHTSLQISERAFHSTIKKDNTFKPLLEGADVKRYLVEWGKKEYISYGDWLGAPRRQNFFIKPRILIRQIVSGNPLRIYAGYTEEELYNVQSIFNLILKENVGINIKYVLAIINSSLMNYYHRHKYLDLSKNLFQKILIQNCKKFPIKIIDEKNKSELNTHDSLVKLVEQMLQLNKELQEAVLPGDKEMLQRRISYTDSSIDRLVYELYDLSEEEIALINS